MSDKLFHYLRQSGEWLNSFWGVFWVFGVFGNWIWWHFIITDLYNSLHVSMDRKLHLLGDNLPYIYSLIYMPIVLMLLIKRPVNGRLQFILKVVLIILATLPIMFFVSYLLFSTGFPCPIDNFELRCIIMNHMEN